MNILIITYLKYIKIDVNSLTRLHLANLRGYMRMPSLLDYLKKILDQYPDDGQILKVS